MKKPDLFLLDQFMKGQTSAEDEKQLLEWLRSKDSEAGLISYYQERWQATANMPMSHNQQDRIYSRIKEQIRENSDDRQWRQVTGNKRHLRRWISYAASVVLCIAIGLSSHLYTRYTLTEVPVEEVKEYKEYTVSADKGQRASVTLPDGTKVWLNSHTTLTYSNEYGSQERLVSLDGEAYFEVAKDTLHRFVVKTGEMEVEALGTSFNVKAYKEDEKITTTLFEGKIRALTKNQKFILFPNQFASFNRSDGVLSCGVTENVSYASMWRDNELAFESVSLNDIGILLNRMYNVHVEFGSEKIKHFRFSGVIKNNSLDNVFEIISLTAPITYQSSGDTIILRERRK